MAEAAGIALAVLGLIDSALKAIKTLRHIYQNTNQGFKLTYEKAEAGLLIAKIGLRSLDGVRFDRVILGDLEKKLVQINVDLQSIHIPDGGWDKFMKYQELRKMLDAAQEGLAECCRTLMCIITVANTHQLVVLGDMLKGLTELVAQNLSPSRPGQMFPIRFRSTGSPNAAIFTAKLRSDATGDDIVRLIIDNLARIPVNCDRSSITLFQVIKDLQNRTPTGQTWTLVEHTEAVVDLVDQDAKPHIEYTRYPEDTLLHIHGEGVLEHALVIPLQRPLPATRGLKEVILGNLQLDETPRDLEIIEKFDLVQGRLEHDETQVLLNLQPRDNRFIIKIQCV